MLRATSAVWRHFETNTGDNKAQLIKKCENLTPSLISHSCSCSSLHGVITQSQFDQPKKPNGVVKRLTCGAQTPLRHPHPSTSAGLKGKCALSLQVCFRTPKSQPIIYDYDFFFWTALCFGYIVSSPAAEPYFYHSAALRHLCVFFS